MKNKWLWIIGGAFALYLYSNSSQNAANASLLTQLQTATIPAATNQIPTVSTGIATSIVDS